MKVSDRFIGQRLAGCAQRLFYGPLPLVAMRCRRKNLTHAQHVLTRKRLATRGDATQSEQSDHPERGDQEQDGLWRQQWRCRSAIDHEDRTDVRRG